MIQRKSNRNGMTPVAKYISLIASACLLSTFSLAAGANALKGISYASLPNDMVQVALELSETADEPLVFTIDNPARIALDLKETTNELSPKSDNTTIGVVTGYSTAEANGRTRVVINLSQMTTYDATVDGNTVLLKLGNPTGATVDNITSPVTRHANSGVATENSIRDISFERGRSGEGLVRVLLPNAKTSVDLRQEGDKLVVDILGTKLPAALQRNLDVTDFSTPVYEIKSVQNAANTRMEIKLDVQNEHLAYQSNEEFIIEVKPLSVAQAEAAKKDKDQYTGEKLSLNFQDIEVRSVLQLLADFTGLNVVVSDTVGGNLTLRLQNVPWDQALDIILRTKGLAKRQTGNVMLIAPAAEIANAERLELEAAQQVRELEPLQIEYINVNYADVNDLLTILTSDEAGLLDERGSIATDPRTNTLIVRSTASQIVQIRSLIAQLDIPVKQVLIESRVVSATDDFSKSLGVQFGFSRRDLINSEPGTTPFTANADGEQPRSFVIGGREPGDTNVGITGFNDGTNEAYLVNLPSTLTGASVGLALGKIGTYILQLELSALQAEGRGEVISSPRLVTAANNSATIATGVQIPFQEASSSGATSTSFQDAVLSLDVTPQITPDNKIIMDLQVNRDSVSTTTVNGVPAVNTQSVSTQVIVDNGETVVLGGVYERTVSEAVNRVPFFSDLPYVGWAFRNKLNSDNKSELLIFVTPKILREESQIN